jgi:hypothetical protein
VSQLPGWSAVNANVARVNQPGFDVLARHRDGRELRISVKSVSTGGNRHDYGIGRSFRSHPADVYAFVDVTGRRPWTVYLAGARTAEALALERHRQYQADRRRPEDQLNSWSPKVSRGLLEAMGARENWTLLELPDPADFPPVTNEFRVRARRDAPVPRS